MPYNISIPTKKESHQLGITATFERVNVLLGSNGTGKSNLIRNFRQFDTSFGEKRPVVYVEGGRVIRPPDSVGLNRSNIDEFRNLRVAENRLNANKKDGTLADRIREVLVYLAQIGDRLKIAHSDAVINWSENGNKGILPQREETQLDRLFRLFHDIFPEITLTVDIQSQEIKCKKETAIYNLSGLSDGERQVLALLADVAILSQPNSLVLVDEPELNLNAQLAVRLWDSIEATLSEAVFVYGTHLLAFAMRSNVGKLIILGGQDREPIAVDNVSSLPSDDLRQFLGAIPAILASPGAIVVEGEESSFDSLFYDWVVGQSQIVIVPVGSCYNVSTAARRSGVWEALAPSVSLVGIVDRDFKSDTILQSFEDQSIIVLNLHEAESYLCHPKFICRIASTIGIQEKLPSEDEILNAIVEFAKEQSLSICAKRVFAQLEVRLSASIPRVALESVRTQEQLTQLLLHSARDERKKSDDLLSETNVKKVLAIEFQQFSGAIEGRNIDKLLRLLPGKQLLGFLLHFTGCKSPAQLTRAAKKHLKPIEFTHIEELRAAITRPLNNRTISAA